MLQDARRTTSRANIAINLATHSRARARTRACRHYNWRRARGRIKTCGLPLSAEITSLIDLQYAPTVEGHQRLARARARARERASDNSGALLRREETQRFGCAAADARARRRATTAIEKRCRQIASSSGAAAVSLHCCWSRDARRRAPLAAASAVAYAARGRARARARSTAADQK